MLKRLPSPLRWWRLRAARRERARRNLDRAIRRARACREQCYREYRDCTDYGRARRLLVESWEWDMMVKNLELQKAIG